MIFIIVLIFLIQESNSSCSPYDQQKRSILRRFYSNILNLYDGTLISSRKQNAIVGNFIGDYFYEQHDQTCSWCWIGQSFTLDLMQKCELNTLKIWLWNPNGRYYNFQVYITSQNTEQLIYTTITNKIFITLTIPDQFISQVRIYNRGGSNVNTGFGVIKVEAYYKLKELLQ